MERFVIERDSDRNISFTGELISCVDFSPDKSGYVWKTLELYRTEGGEFVCHRIDFTYWQGNGTQHEAAICEDHDQIIEFFGTGCLAEELYKKARIDYSVKVD